MKKIVDEPTHIGGGNLDQIFIFSIKNQISTTVTVDTEDSLGSDHYPVYCKVGITSASKYFKTIQYRKVKDIDKDLFSNELAAVIDNTFKLDGTFGSVICHLSAATESLLDNHAPFLEKKISVIDSAPWFDKEYRDLRKSRRKAERDFRKEENPVIKSELKLVYKKCCFEADFLATCKKKEYFKRMIENSEGNPRTLYSMINKHLDRKQEKPLPDNAVDMRQLAASFNDYFVSKIEKIRQNLPLCLEPEVEGCPEYEFDTFEPTTVEEIREIIKESGVKCSPSDLLPQELYKDNIEMLLPIITHLVNLSLSTGNCEGVKLADIVPLLKDERLDPNILKNYRPVSNLTFIGKLIERVVLRQLNEHLTKHNLNSCDQFAYKKNHSTETLLIKIVNDLLIASDEKSASVVMLLDLSAAFDTVDHNLLLGILEKEIGLKGTVLSWFRSFLTGRSQRIRLGNTVSEVIEIRFGVPQGSVLGPVLFNLYIRSIYGCVKTLGFKIFGYADDHQIIKSFHPSEQSKVLSVQVENCFSVIKKWMSKFYLQLNDTKTQIIVVGTSRVLDSIDVNGITLCSGTTIRFIPTVKNLGIYMDNRLSFDKHVVDLKKKCFRTLRNIRKIKFLLTTGQTKTIVNSLVISCLDYCNGLFYGASEKIFHQLQLIQNSAVKAVTGKYKHDRMGNDLKRLHWLDVKKRVVFKLALLAHKAIIGKAPDYLQELFQYSHHGHTLKLMIPYAASAAGLRSFSVVGPKIYNNLPDSVKMCYTINMFKTALKTYLFNLSADEIERVFYA